MVIIELTYKKALSEVDRYLALHREFLLKYKGAIVASGPKVPRTGGVILVNVSKQVAQDMIAEDPFYQHGIAEYRFIEFNG
ncbi:MAG: YciI family protein [Coxiellaceae bacterium]|nr:YciI family protein [Coxiellaceae bacterium]